MPLLQDVATALAEADVAYVVAGGVAVLLHGHVRTTVDLDIVVDVAGTPVRVVSLRHLVAMKRLAGREQDKADITALQRIHPGLRLERS